MLGRTYDEALAGTGINITQFAVMRCVSRRLGEPLARVAEELEMDRTSLYRALAPMERDGWIKLAPGTDARSRTAKLTRRGTEILAQAGKGWNEVQKQIIGRFGKGEWAALVSELNRLADCAEPPP